jgi:hypothetical protein
MTRCSSKLLSLACVLAVGVQISACSTGPTFTTAGRSGSAPAAGEAIRVFAGPCLGSPEQDPFVVQPGAFALGAVLAPVAGAFASSFAQAAVSALGNAAKAAGTDRTTTLIGIGTAPSMTALLEAVRQSGSGESVCVQAVVGQFVSADTDASERSGLGSLRERLRLANIPLAAPPRLAVEYQLQFPPSAVSGRAPAFRLRETWRVANGTLVGQAASSAGQELVISVFLVPFDADIARATPASVPVERSSVSLARYYDPTTRVAPTTLWLPLSEDIMAKPLNILVSVAETQNGDAFLAALGEALTNSQTTSAVGTAASTLAQRAVNPEARRDARLAELAAERTRADDALRAYADAEQAISDARACTTRCDRLAAKARVYVSLARRRFTTIGLPAPEFDLSGL